MESDSYQFPRSKLKNIDPDDSREPIVLMLCGSFSPVTYLHLRIFEMACDEINLGSTFVVLGGFFSPVHDEYKKRGLAASNHRLEMCRLAVEDSDWLMIDDWETRQPNYSTTRKVLDHFNQYLNNGSFDGKRRIRPVLLAGGDLIESFKVPDLWAPEDVRNL